MTNANKTRIIILLPIIIALGWIPLIVHEKVYDTKLSQFEWFADRMDIQSDFFLYYKMVLIVFVGICMLLCMAIYWKEYQRTSMEKPIIALLVYLGFVILSGLNSQYKYFVVHGTYEMFETVFAVIAYVVICIYTSYTLKEKEDFLFVFKWASVGVALVVMIGFLQYCGFDLFRTKFGKMLISNPSSWGDLDRLQFTFPDRTVYTTLYNTNYLAFFIGIIFPICVALLIYEKNIRKRIGYAIFSIICLVDLIGSNSRSGLLALMMSAVVISILFVNNIKKYAKYMAAMLGVFILLVGAYVARIGGFGDLLGHIVGGVVDNTPKALSGVETTDQDVVFHFKEGYDMHISYEVFDDNSAAYITCLDENGTEISYDVSEDGVTKILSDTTKYADCTIEPVLIDENVGILVSVDGLDWVFCNCVDEKGTYYYYNSAAKFVSLGEIEKSNLLPDSLISGRGELWNYTIPILKKYVFLGSGANTFLMAYPQNNYFVKKYRHSEYLFDVKAHSLYLQQFVENGMIALLAFIIAYLIYFVQTCKLMRAVKHHDIISTLGIGIFAGTITYMVVAIANDSTVNTAPMFWCVWGIGMAINRYIRKNQTKYTE